MIDQNKLQKLDQDMGRDKSKAEKGYEKMTALVDEYMESIDADDKEWRKQVLIDFTMFYVERLKMKHD